MTVEMLGTTLANQIGSAMATVADSMKESLLRSNTDTCRYILLTTTLPVLRKVPKVRHLCRFLQSPVSGVHHVPFLQMVLIVTSHLMVTKPLTLPALFPRHYTIPPVRLPNGVQNQGCCLSSWMSYCDTTWS